MGLLFKYEPFSGNLNTVKCAMASTGAACLDLGFWYAALMESDRGRGKARSWWVFYDLFWIFKIQVRPFSFFFNWGQLGSSTQCSVLAGAIDLLKSVPLISKDWRKWRVVNDLFVFFVVLFKFVIFLIVQGCAAAEQGTKRFQYQTLGLFVAFSLFERKPSLFSLLNPSFSHCLKLSWHQGFGERSAEEEIESNRWKQALMSDPYSVPSFNSSCCNKSRAFSIFSSPRLFVGVSSSSSSDSEAAMSPTSILETKSLSSIGRQLLSNATKSSGAESKPHARSFGDTEAVGLGIIDALNEEKSTKAYPNSKSRMVVFGSLLKVQIPSLCPSSMSPVGSPIEFGIKNKESQLALLSRAQSSIGLEMTASSSCMVFARSISMSEMELSEDYTCVISHGPNPRTTHIFDNCIVESCGDGFTGSIESNSSAPTDRRGHLSNDFLSFCYACKKDLGQGNGTFIYRFVCSPIAG